MREIIIESYNPQWPIDFAKIEAYLRDGLNDSVLAIEHIGSTAVEGLAAKPIIDIDVVIESYDDFEDVKNTLKILGYYHNGDQGIKDREVFKYEALPFAVHHLYVCPKDSLELNKHITFRNYLRKNKAALDAYAIIKKEAARKHRFDIEGYLDMKGVFIKEIYSIFKL